MASDHTKLTAEEFHQLTTRMIIRTNKCQPFRRLINEYINQKASLDMAEAEIDRLEFDLDEKNAKIKFFNDSLSKLAERVDELEEELKETQKDKAAKEARILDLESRLASHHSIT